MMSYPENKAYWEQLRANATGDDQLHTKVDRTIAASDYFLRLEHGDVPDDPVANAIIARLDKIIELLTPPRFVLSGDYEEPGGRVATVID